MSGQNSPPGPLKPLQGTPAGRRTDVEGGNKKRKVLGGMVVGLLLLAALVCVAGYFLFDGDDLTTGDTDRENSASGTTDVTQRGGIDPTSNAPSEAEGATNDADEDDDAGKDAGIDAEIPDAVAPEPEAAVAPAPVPVMEPIPVDPTLGNYDDPIEFPIIPVAVALLPSGKVMTWSAFVPDDFFRGDRYVVSGGGTGETQHAIFDPETEEVTAMTVSHTNHDMFCPGITQMPNGDIVVTGGQNADKTSIYHLADGTWAEAETMNIARGYGSSCLLSNGKVFVLGGSWSGPKDLKKDAEVYDPTLGTWTLLPGIQAAFILTDDPEGVYRADNYGWFFPWSAGSVFHAGPSTTMHWFDTKGEGSALVAGTRPGHHSHNGNAVMFDTGKILTAGGAEAFAKPEFPSTTESSLIEIGKAHTQVKVKELSPMNLARAYANAVVLPDGKVFVTGGAHKPKEFYDGDAQYQPEIWDPATEEWVLMDSPHKVARTYHSTGLLMLDGRVFTGGSGLCGGCAVNHLDAEIYNPPYLFNPDGTWAARPNITVSAKTATHGDSLEVTANEQLMMVSMIRFGSATHSTNTDQRRLELCGPFTSPCGLSPVNVTIPADPGISLAGYWMFFGVNAKGTPSEAEVVLVNSGA